jgi:hypothetical protein
LSESSDLSSDEKKRDEKGGGYGDSPAVVSTVWVVEDAVTV